MNEKFNFENSPLIEKDKNTTPSKKFFLKEMLNLLSLEEKSYLEKIKKIPRLKEEETLKLIKKIKDGKNKKIISEDKEIISEDEEKLILANLQLVVEIARQYTHKGFEFFDLIQEGNLKLIEAVKAIETFDNTKSKFSTYIKQLIKYAIFEAFYKEGIIRVPEYMGILIGKFLKAQNALEEKLKRIPTTEEIANYMKIDLEKVKEIEEAIQIKKVSSLDEIINTKGHDYIFEKILKENIKDKKANFEEEIIDKAIIEEIKKIVLSLKNEKLRNKEIFIMRFGLDGKGIQTFEKIGKKFSRSRERIQQICNEIIKKIKNLQRFQKIYKDYFKDSHKIKK